MVHDGKVLAPVLCVLGRGQIRLDWKGSLRWKNLKPSAGGVGASGVDQYDAAMGEGQLEWDRLIAPLHCTGMSLPPGKKASFPAGPLRACPLQRMP